MWKILHKIIQPICSGPGLGDSQCKLTIRVPSILNCSVTPYQFILLLSVSTSAGSIVGITTLRLDCRLGSEHLTYTCRAHRRVRVYSWGHIGSDDDLNGFWSSVLGWSHIGSDDDLNGFGGDVLGWWLIGSDDDLNGFGGDVLGWWHVRLDDDLNGFGGDVFHVVW